MDKIGISVVDGVAGPSLSIDHLDECGNPDVGTRIAGPKPWGGGSITHSFTVDIRELLSAIKSNAPTADIFKIDAMEFHKFCSEYCQEREANNQYGPFDVVLMYEYAFNKLNGV